MAVVCDRLFSGWLDAQTLPDIDGKNLQTAQRNVSSNQLQSRIRLLKQLPSDPLIPRNLIESQELVVGCYGRAALN